MEVKEFKFRKLIAARKKAIEIKRKFGFRPNVLKVTSPKTKKSFFVVVKARGLKRVDR